jgi:shikimate dehydrogenase
MAEAPNYKAELVGVFGHPVAENPTVVMHEAAYAELGLNWRYLTIEVLPQDLAAAMRGMRAMNMRGINLTIPHKVAVLEYLDEVKPGAAVMGAVNTVVRDGDRLVGENTDGKGFLESLRPLRDPAGARVLVLGAGGAARAVAVELALAGARAFTVVNRTAARGQALVDLLRGKVRERVGRELEATFVPWVGDLRVPEGTDVVVNTTSVGLFPDVDARLALDVSSLTPGMVVADVIPNPPRTRLVRDAAARGCKVIDGLGMLVGQGRLGIQYWTGTLPDGRVMREALEKVFGEG